VGVELRIRAPQSLPGKISPAYKGFITVQRRKATVNRATWQTQVDGGLRDQHRLVTVEIHALGQLAPGSPVNPKSDPDLM
jgi:hypothetical protein